MNDWICFDFMEILNVRKLFAVAFFVCVAHQTRGVSDYLKEAGPVPLRFSLAAAAPLSFILPDSLVERQKPTNTVQVASSSTTSENTNTVVSPLPSPSTTPGNPVVHTTTDPQNGSVPTPSASDMLVVSPQMLTEFFKPVTDGTNSPGTVIVPVPVGFTPPSAKPSSRATYNSP